MIAKMNLDFKVLIQVWIYSTPIYGWENPMGNEFGK
jgi:hypothetical protein